MRAHILLLALTMGLGPAALGQNSDYVLSRSRIVSLSADTAWSNCIEVVKAAPVIVNTIDSASRLVAFSMPLGAQDVKNLVLDAKDIEKQPLTLHVTIWISDRGKDTRLYVRAAPNGGGFFSHSNGQIEQRILDAIEKGGKWLAADKEPAPHTIAGAPPEAVTAKAIETTLGSSRLKLNASSPKPAVITISLMIPSTELGKFAPALTKHYYPGAAHVTLWFEPSGSGTGIRTRTLIFESGSLSPVPLGSNDKLESTLLAAIEGRVNGSADAQAGVGSDYRGKLEFWNVLFGLDAPLKGAEERPSVVRELPAPLEKAWAAGLQVITQSQVMIGVDRASGTLEFLAAHSSQTGTRYSVHKVVVAFASAGAGTRMSLSVHRAQDTTAESDSELKAMADRIGTELFVKDRVTWLTTKRGSK